MNPRRPRPDLEASLGTTVDEAAAGGPGKLECVVSHESRESRAPLWGGALPGLAR